MAASKTDESESEKQRNKEVGTQCCIVVKMFRSIDTQTTNNVMSKKVNLGVTI